MSNLGNLLKRARETMACSQEGVAKTLNITQSSMSRYEAGLVTPPDEVIRALATFYNVPAGPLLAAAWQEKVPPELAVGVKGDGQSV